MIALFQYWCDAEVLDIKRGDWLAVFAALVWAIWGTRNKIVFQQRSLKTARDMVGNLEATALEWYHAYLKK